MDKGEKSRWEIETRSCQTKKWKEGEKDREKQRRTRTENQKAQFSLKQESFLNVCK